MQCQCKSERVLTLAVCLILAAPAVLAQEAKIDIPYSKFVLDNGLTLLVHEDHKAPIVAVNIWYHVGSKNEKKGKTGFAHLFEHLMFNGSEHFNNDYFKVLEKLGATDMNGTTNNDRTNFFQNVPTSALDTVLWMESDRMGFLLGAVDQARLDEQRGVVQNEKRQGENEPYGLVYNTITENTYPAGHPYSWTVIGSMEDLNAASLDDVREWFKSYYGPSNATIAIAGDIDPETAKAKVEKYFGAIPPGPPVQRQDVWIAKMTGTHRARMQDRVPQARIYKVWNIPQMYARDATYLDLVSDVLGSGKTSRLYKRLVYDDQIATDASAYIDLNEISGQFYIEATARPGGDLGAVEKAIDEELAKFLANGPTPEELKRVQTRSYATFVRGIERIGGFGGKSDVLARGQVFAGDPEAYKKQRETIDTATTAELKEAAVRWLSDGVFILEVHPFPNYKVLSKTDVDRSKVPEAGPAPSLKFPAIQHATLSNGMKIVLAQRHEIPVVNFRLLLDAGYASDQFSSPGVASMAMDMLDEGTKTRSSLQISDEADSLGARLATGSNLDMSYVTLSALKINLDKSLDLFADVILDPAFPQADFLRVQKQKLAGIQREKVQPVSIALRVIPALMYGKGHAYGNPFTGTGTTESVQKMTREDLMKFHQTWFKPNNGTLIIVGDTTLAEIQPKLEKLFDEWKPGEVPHKNVAAVAQKDASHIYIIDRPGAQQSVIIAGNVAPPRNNPDEIALETMNTILGGQFVSRLNMNLREDKHWSYGAQSLFYGARGQRPFFAAAPVQTDKTKESVVEIEKELSAILKDKPATAEELDMAKDSETLAMPGSIETANSVASDLEQIVRYGLPENYFETYSSKVRALTRQDIATAAERVLHPDKLIWVVVGDRSKIEQGLKDLNYGPVSLLDGDGNPVN